MWALQALAQPARVQVELFPSFVEVADELALEHEEAQANWRRASGCSGLFEDQIRALEAVDSLIEQMSGSEKADVLWTVEALERRAEWGELRSRARTALASLGWADEPPPRHRGHEFVSGPGE